MVDWRHRARFSLEVEKALLKSLSERAADNLHPPFFEWIGSLNDQRIQKMLCIKILPAYHSPSTHL